MLPHKKNTITNERVKPENSYRTEHKAMLHLCSKYTNTRAECIGNGHCKATTHFFVCYRNGEISCGREVFNHSLTSMRLCDQWVEWKYFLDRRYLNVCIMLFWWWGCEWKELFLTPKYNPPYKRVASAGIARKVVSIKFFFFFSVWRGIVCRYWRILYATHEIEHKAAPFGFIDSI